MLTELCTQLKTRLTQQMTGKPAAPIKVRSKEEAAEREAAMDDFSKMLAEAKLAKGELERDRESDRERQRAAETDGERDRRKRGAHEDEDDGDDLPIPEEDDGECDTRARTHTLL